MNKILRYILFGIAVASFGFLLSCRSECRHPYFTTQAVAATCDREGYISHHCTKCSYYYKTDITPPTGHTLAETVSVPTCTEQGYTEYRCTCGYSFRGNFLPPVGHTYSTQTISATCETEGYTECHCTQCSHSYKQKIYSATGHALCATVHEPTCTESGYTEYACTNPNCDLVYRANYTEPQGHSLQTTYIRHPTLTESGKWERQCTKCAYRFVNFPQYADIFFNAYTENTVCFAKGVDISYHNHKPNDQAATGYEPLNWQAIRDAGFTFAILRAGYTGSQSHIGKQDPVFEMDYRDAKAAGLHIGVYYYSYARSREEAISEAETLIAWLAGKQLDYPIYYDLEDPALQNLGKETLTQCCIAFIDTLRQAGYYGALYSNHNWLTNYLAGDTLKNYGELWYARYQKDPILPQQPQNGTAEEIAQYEAAKQKYDEFNVLPTDDRFAWSEAYGKQVGMWQYTERGIIENSGIRQYVCFDYAFRDYPGMMKRFCLNGYTAS